MYGRTLGLVEMRRIMTAERVVNTYRAWMAGDMAKWAAANPNDFEFISTVAKLYEQRKPKVKRGRRSKH